MKEMTVTPNKNLIQDAQDNTFKVIKLTISVVALCITASGAIYGTYTGATAHADQRIGDLKQEISARLDKMEELQTTQAAQLHQVDKAVERILTIVEERLGPPRSARRLIDEASAP